MQKDFISRPTIFGPKNQLQLLTLPLEITVRTLNVGGLVHLVARAKVGKKETDSDWQLQRFLYDASGAISAVIWPIFTGVITPNYFFQYGPDNKAGVTGVSQSQQAVVQAANSYENGDLVYFDNVLGMVDLNFTGNNLYTVANATPSSFELKGVDSRNFAPYTSGGIAHVLPALQYGFA